MARGGKREKAGRKPTGDRIAVLVRLDRDLAERVESARNGKSMSATVERLLRSALANPQSDDDAANRALGFVVAQAAFATAWGDGKHTWQNNRSAAEALKLAFPHIVDLLTIDDASTEEPPIFHSAEEKARWVYFWVLNRLKERGDEYGTDWPDNHPLRNFPKAAAALKFSNKGRGT